TRIVRASPTRRTSPSCSTRKSETWSWRGRSAISSRRSVPPSASSKRPRLALTAPVKAPLAWPNSSLSMSCSGIAPQLTATKGRSARGERSCKARAFLGLAQYEKHFVGTKRLPQVVVRPCLHRLERQVVRPVRAHHDHRGVRRLFLHGADELQPVDARHPHVGDERVVVAGRQL